MAKNKLNPEQREALLTWLAADYDSSLIRFRFQQKGWPEIGKNTISHYRRRWASRIKAAQVERHSKALITGLALREERIERLKYHADELDAIKWQPDEKGRLPNEKAWRETLNDIAVEMGHRKQILEHTGRIKLDALTDEELEQLESLARKMADASGGA